MQELRGVVIDRLGEIAGKKHKSVLESIVLAGTARPDETDSRSMPMESILGNIFFTLLAGHETTGNTMAFALNLLAIYPEYQRNIQQDFDRLFEARPWKEWTVEQEYQTLQQGWLNAVLKEVLRLYCVVKFIPRTIVAPITVIDSKNEPHKIPEKTFLSSGFLRRLPEPKKVG